MRQDAEATCCDLLTLEPALWTFACVEGIEPTNYAAEQLQRHPAQWRKMSYGSDSVAGGRFVASILTIVATCRQQGKKILEVLIACSQAVLTGEPLPSLLPQGTSCVDISLSWSIRERILLPRPTAEPQRNVPPSPWRKTLSTTSSTTDDRRHRS